MNQDLRQRILIAILPALLIGMTYVFLGARPLSQKLAELRKNKPPSTPPIKATKFKKSGLEEDIDALHETLSRLASGAEDPVGQAAAVQSLIRVFEANGCALIRSETAKAPVTLAINLKWLESQSDSGARRRRFMKLELLGPYLSATKAMEQASKLKLDAIVHSLSLSNPYANDLNNPRRDAANPTRAWVLWIWL